MRQPAYTFDTDLGIWRTARHETLAYSDGTRVEDRLLSILRQTRDVSSTSDELRRHIVHWPSEYHFSSARHNLLRAFKIDPKHRILELGCGCGAITRYLGETGATVVAIEGSRLRAQIAAERCRDLPNVSVVCDNLASFESPDKFDFVTLIGVLEYSPQFIVGDDPVGACLGKAKSHLSNDGNLLVAIENRLGLKYFSGCNEDHVGREFVGIEDLYDARTVVTLGRRELLAALQIAGFDFTQHLYPFPDYKLPTVIISESGAAETRFATEDLLLRIRSANSDPISFVAFSEPLAWSSVCRNGLLPDLSNSFLIIAAGTHAPLTDKVRSFLALGYSGTRLGHYATETVFYLDDRDIVVTKHALWPDLVVPRASAGPLKLNCGTTPYVSGQHYLRKLMRQWRKSSDIDQLCEWARPWTEVLLAAVPNGRRGERHSIPGVYFDCIPFNLIETRDGRLHIIDREWQIDGKIPLSWVFIRGLAYALANCITPAGASATLRSIISEVAGRLGIPLEDRDFFEASNRECAIQAQITGSATAGRYLEQLLGRMPPVTWTIFDAYRHSEEVKSRLEATLTATTASRSWKITRPLRFLHSLLSPCDRT